MKPEKAAALEQLQAIPDVMADWTELVHKIECGVLHSNIPVCCVVFFTHGWHDLERSEQDAYDTLTEDMFPGGYMPCPECLEKYLYTGSFRKLRRCGCECQCCSCQKERDPSYVCPHGRGHLEAQVVSA